MESADESTELWRHPSTTFLTSLDRDKNEKRKTGFIKSRVFSRGYVLNHHLDPGLSCE